MLTISPDNSDLLLTRFYSFMDAVVESVFLQTAASGKICVLRIKTQDTDAKHGWSLVELTCSGVHAFRFEYGRHTYEVLSSGLQLLWRNDLLHVILDAYPDDPGLPDLETNGAFASCEKCELEVISSSH